MGAGSVVRAAAEAGLVTQKDTEITEKAISNTNGTNHTNMLTLEEIDAMSDQEVAV